MAPPYQEKRDDQPDDAVARAEIAELALRDSEARFRSFIDHSSSYIYAKDLEGRYILANQAYLDLFGYRSQGELLGLTDVDRFGHEVDWTANDREVVRTGQPVEVEETASFPDGLHTYLSSKFPLRDSRGAIVAVGGISTDITARKRAEELRLLLAREVDHRAKNALAAVQAIAMLTTADTVKDFRKALMGRIQAMAKAHTLLAANRWSGGDLGTLVRDELQAWEDRVRAEGPPVELAAETVQACALALHELATNAAKYGALSCPTGMVQVGWTLDSGTVRLVWRESGGPPVTSPGRQGIGTELLFLGIENQAGGQVRLDWDTGGLVCRLDLPVLGKGEPTA